LRSLVETDGALSLARWTISGQQGVATAGVKSQTAQAALPYRSCGPPGRPRPLQGPSAQFTDSINRHSIPTERISANHQTSWSLHLFWRQIKGKFASLIAEASRISQTYFNL